MNCPFCQTNIKKNADVITCEYCHTPHHKECWEDNKGCTTYGCKRNPNTKTKDVIDVGNETVANIERMLDTGQNVELIECPSCHNKIEKTSLYCKICGYNLNENISDKDKQKFEEEFKRRYKQNVKINRGRKIFLGSSISILSLLIVFGAYFSYVKLKQYYSSEDYRIKVLLKNWESAWENKDIAKYKEFLEKDYIYYDRDNKPVKFDDKIKRMQWSFDNYKNIKIHISGIKISYDSTDANYANVIFKQSYVSDKKEESGKKTLRLYKGIETDNNWKIFREYFE